MSAVQSMGQQLKRFCDDFDALRREIGKTIVGQGEAVDGLLTALVAGGHVLVEGVPGLGKTVLVQALSDAVELSFQRIQFTADLMPSDLLGTYVVMETPQGRRTFEFQKGPIFSHLVLADQINRGVPRTQAALLEAMEGQQITVASETFELPQPFCVVATQNPLEMEGTFPLPEPEIDRFLLKLIVAPPTAAETEQILERTTEGEPPILAAVVDGHRLLEMRAVARSVMMDAALRRWIVRLVEATHPDRSGSPEMVRRLVRYGVSPRGAQAVVLAAKIHAAAEGRGAVTKQDVEAVLHPALRHRLILNYDGQAETAASDTLIDSVVRAVPAGGSD